MPSSSPIIGHKRQVAELLQDLQADNVAHAYLFTGKRSLGKFTVAKWFAKQLLLADAADAADRERREHEIDHLIYRDFLVIDRLWIEDVCEDEDLIAKFSNISQQHRAKQPTAKTDTIGIDDVRALQERLRDVGDGRFRCCLIRDVARMKDEAVSALLKILEEPPPGVVFLLTATSTSGLLPTLVSRARVVRFSPLPVKELMPLVSGVADDDVAFLLRVAQGAPGLVIRLKADPDLLRTERQMNVAALSFWRSRSLAERLHLLEPLAERTEEAERLLLHLALALRHERSPSQNMSVAALQLLLSDLKTNASRPLMVQRFALTAGVSR